MNSLRNAGKSWTSMEDRKLEDQFIGYQKTVPQLAQIFGRTELAILCRLEKLGLIAENQQTHKASYAMTNLRDNVELDRLRYQADTVAKRPSLNNKIKAHINGLIDTDFYVLAVELTPDEHTILLREYVNATIVLEGNISKTDRKKYIYLRKVYRNSLTEHLLVNQPLVIEWLLLNNIIGVQLCK